MRVLVVDDDLELSRLVAYALRQSGYVVHEAPDGPSALAAFREAPPDLAILDVNLPRLGGLELLRTIRAEGSTVPVMMLTVRSAEEDQVQALDLGADDYLTKPFSPRTLLARVRALLRRTGEGRSPVLAAGDFALDVEAQTVRVRGAGEVKLTKLELRLLQLFLACAGQTLAADRLAHHVWGWRGTGDRQLLKQLVHRLRQKIERDPAAPEYLQTVAGAGYRMVVEREAGPSGG